VFVAIELTIRNTSRTLLARIIVYFLMKITARPVN